MWNGIHVLVQEKMKDTKGIIRHRKSEDRQYLDQKEKKDKKTTLKKMLDRSTQTP